MPASPISTKCGTSRPLKFCIASSAGVDTAGVRHKGHQRRPGLLASSNMDYGITAMSFLALVLWPLGEFGQCYRVVFALLMVTLQPFPNRTRVRQSCIHNLFLGLSRSFQLAPKLLKPTAWDTFDHVARMHFDLIS